MVIRPKIRNNICLNAHPTGCLEQVRDQIAAVRACGRFTGPGAALIIGASNGYGLASRIAAAFGCGAGTVGISYERPPTESRTASAGWYNDAAFIREAEAAGLTASGINGDAFSDDVKGRACELVRDELGSVDLVVYSIASPRRMDPATGTLHSSVIKPIGRSYTAKTLDFQSGEVSSITAEPATADEIADTVKVMGGDDWRLWIEALLAAGVLSGGVKTIAYSYLGPAITYPIYRDGTIGEAKKDLERTAGGLGSLLRKRLGGEAVVSVNKALVTRASAVIPAVPLYISLLYRVMKERGLHEGCIEQMDRLFRDRLYPAAARLGNAGVGVTAGEDRGADTGSEQRDGAGRIRMDDREMCGDVQREVEDLWETVETENVERMTDIEGFREEFLRHHGFGMPGVDYSRDVDPLSV